ncbi:hypothetical protein HA49_05410 [Tatumella morbirosei]|uniref:Uncharacterized protein n=1 Tax=Tatumella morbirosei TaxID=642227 RepID=A0A095TDI5_9GAMM|nr:hypothetical protein HA49_05410 [Tatumella morbirosei]
MRESRSCLKVPCAKQIRDQTCKKDGVFLCVTAQNLRECSPDHILSDGGVGRGMMNRRWDKFTLDSEPVIPGYDATSEFTQVTEGLDYGPQHQDN